MKAQLSEDVRGDARAFFALAFLFAKERLAVRTFLARNVAAHLPIHALALLDGRPIAGPHRLFFEFFHRWSRCASTQGEQKDQAQ